MIRDSSGVSTLSGHVNLDVICILCPGGRGKIVENKDMAQLSQYQATLSCGAALMRRYMSVGMLVDEHKVRFAFSPWSFMDSLPAPLTLITPAMKWR